MRKFALFNSVIASICLIAMPFSALADFNTPIKAVVSSPIFGANISSDFTTLDVQLSANGNASIVGHPVDIVPVVCNTINYLVCEPDWVSSKKHTFASLDETANLSFVMPMYFQNANYILFYVYDNVTGEDDFARDATGVEDTQHYINYSGGLLPLYRFWSIANQHHFFTQDFAEKSFVINNYDDNTWLYEQIAYFVYRADNCSGSPVYRFWSNTKQGHFYTISENEKNYVINNYDDNEWKYEKIAFCANTTGTQPVYRFWSDTYQGHFYTISQAEKDLIIATYPTEVWRYEGIAYYAIQ